MRGELIQEIEGILEEEGIHSDSMHAKLVVCMSKWNVEKAVTDLTTFNAVEYNKHILKRYIVACAVKGLTKRTIQQYQTSLKFIFDKIGKQIDLITSDDLKLYLAMRQLQDGVSETTIGNDWRSLSAFYVWMTKEELIAKNPMLKVDRPKERKKAKKAFTQMDVEKIRSKCKDSREKALVEVLLSTWCRVTEVSRMNISDIKPDGSMKVLGKGDKERIVYLNAKAQLAIDEYLQTRDDDNEALFVSSDKPHERLSTGWIEKTIRDLGKIAAVDDTHPHRFRRTGATFALRSGMKIETVSHLLGHEQISTTQIYLDLNEEEMSQAHRKYVN